MMGLAPAPDWLETDWVLGQFGPDHRRAWVAYAAFADEGLAQPNVWDGLRHQVFLGTEQFVECPSGEAKPLERLRGVPRAQRRPLAKPLVWFDQAYPVRREAMAQAFLIGVYTMKEIADHFGVHYSTVSRAVRWYEKDRLSRPNSS